MTADQQTAPAGMAAQAPTPPAAQQVRALPSWLARREPADAAARAVDLVERLHRHVPTAAGWVVHDLGSGTGSMTRWLAPRLAGQQHWILYDRDAELLERAGLDGVRAADGSPVTVETRNVDITRLAAGELNGAGLITASALLDMLTQDELDRIVVSCAAANCPVLVTLSVTGRVDLTPPDPWDEPIAEAFNAHQRRSTPGGRLLGPDAVGAAVHAFGRSGHHVVVRLSPWRLGAADVDLTAEWLRGWCAAAAEQQPEWTVPIAQYAERRQRDAATGRLRVVLHHHDVLALPR